MPNYAAFTNDEWLGALQGPGQGAALEGLRAILVRGLRIALKKYVRGSTDTIAEDFAQEALVKVLDNLNSFRGTSRFTTWAQKIAVHEALTALRRKHWQDVALEDLMPRDAEGSFTPEALTDDTPSPEGDAARRLALGRVQHLIETQLSERQQQALVALMEGMPISEAAERLGTNRNALYKLIYDARKRLVQALADQGLTPEDLLDEL